MLPEFKLSPVEKVPLGKGSMRELYIKILDTFIEAPNRFSMVTIEGKKSQALVQGLKNEIARPEYKNLLKAVTRENNVYLIKFNEIQKKEDLL